MVGNQEYSDSTPVLASSLAKLLDLEPLFKSNRLRSDLGIPTRRLDGH